MVYGSLNICFWWLGFYFSVRVVYLERLKVEVDILEILEFSLSVSMKQLESRKFYLMIRLLEISIKWKKLDNLRILRDN